MMRSLLLNLIQAVQNQSVYVQFLLIENEYKCVLIRFRLIGSKSMGFEITSNQQFGCDYTICCEKMSAETKNRANSLIARVNFSRLEITILQLHDIPNSSVSANTM